LTHREGGPLSAGVRVFRCAHGNIKTYKYLWRKGWRARLPPRQKGVAPPGIAEAGEKKFDGPKPLKSSLSPSVLWG
jgi:hypothetical protein